MPDRICGPIPHDAGKPALFMNASAAMTNVRARGAGREASGEDFRSETWLFPLAPSPVPLDWPVEILSLL
jgi:hypothetical protein